MDDIEILALARKGGGGGGGSTTNYNTLSNKPKIAGTELSGNKTLSQLGIQAALTFDEVPTNGSQNPVKSDGVYDALVGKQDTLTFDNVPTSASDNPAKSGGIYTALSGKVDKETGKALSTNDFTTLLKEKLEAIESGAQANVIERITANGTEIVPSSKTVALELLTTTVSNLANYYLKTETYTQDEVNALINSLTGVQLAIVEELPTTDISTNTIYMIETTPDSHIYNQFMYINSAWANLGNTTVDLTNYYTKTQVDDLLDAKQDVLTFDSVPTALSENPVTSGGVYTALGGKQDSLTFDATPTQSSTNPVTSGGVYTSLSGKQDALTFDATPTDGSTNPVTSDGVYDALAGKQDALTFDSAPTSGSTNPVTSGGVYTALGEVTAPIATTQTVGTVKPDGTSITIDNDGTIHGASTLDFDERDFVEDSGTVSLVDSQRIFTGTQAEWDALSTAVKKTYGQVNITDDEASSAEAYSTEETYTGKVWIDGKPIYRKTIHFGALPNATTKTVDSGISNLDYIISMNSMVKATNANEHRPLPYVTYQSTNQTNVYFSGSNIIVTTQIDFSQSDCYITLEYTKTTD